MPPPAVLPHKKLFTVVHLPSATANPGSVKDTIAMTTIAAPSEFNSNNTITGNNISGADDNFHLQLHSTANSSTQDDLTIQRPKEDASSILNATDAASLTYSTIIFSPTRNSTAHEDLEQKYRISLDELGKRQQLNLHDKMRIFGKNAELVVPANANYTLVRKVDHKAVVVRQPSVAKVKRKVNNARRIVDSDSSSESDDTDILDLMRGIVIEQRFVKKK